MNAMKNTLPATRALSSGIVASDRNAQLAGYPNPRAIPSSMLAGIAKKGCCIKINEKVVNAPNIIHDPRRVRLLIFWLIASARTADKPAEAKNNALAKNTKSGLILLMKASNHEKERRNHAKVPDNRKTTAKNFFGEI
jgi:hypothetical protein